jgi:two-component system response regulator
MTPPLVLLVDNDRAINSLLAEVTRRAGCRVAQAYHGEEAQGLLVDPSIRLLVCDLDMPRMPGLELLEWLATQPHRPKTLVVSGFVDSADLERAARLPFVHSVLRKPFDLDTYTRLVQELALAPLAASEAATER